MWHAMGIPGKGAVIALLVMAAWSIRYTIDRALKFSAARSNPRFGRLVRIDCPPFWMARKNFLRATSVEFICRLE